MTNVDFIAITAYLKIIAQFARCNLLRQFQIKRSNGDNVHYFVYTPTNSLANLYDKIISNTSINEFDLIVKIKDLSNSIWYGYDRIEEIRDTFFSYTLDFIDEQSYTTVCDYLSIEKIKPINFELIANIAGAMEIRLDKIPLSKYIENGHEQVPDPDSIFIVHGHNNELKLSVARFIEKLQLKVIILHEQPNLGQTIIEKLEAQIDKAKFAIILYTPCDEGRAANSKTKLRKRARQNVILEHGYLMAKLGRENVVALVSEDVEIPSDISGICYIGYDNGNEWQQHIIRELKKAGFNIDANKIF